jgi:ClpP class serine protease
MVYGTPELARKIFNARGSKPIVAIANPMAASAALWAGTAADRFYITPSGEAGSHGVYSMHMDYSKALENDGVKVTFVSAGKFKTEGSPYEPPSDEFLASEQSTVDEIMGEFTSALARHRGKASSYVLENFGQGRLLSAKKAVEVGLADGVMTFEQVVSRLLSGHIRTGQAASADDLTTPVQDEFHERRFGNVGDLQRKLAIARR